MVLGAAPGQLEMNGTCSWGGGVEGEMVRSSARVMIGMAVTELLSASHFVMHTYYSFPLSSRL